MGLDPKGPDVFLVLEGCVLLSWVQRRLAQRRLAQRRRIYLSISLKCAVQCHYQISGPGGCC